VAAGEIRVAINSDQDIVSARQKGRLMASEIGFSSGDATLIATAISELARNIVSYARTGQITIKAVNGLNRQGIAVIATDDGPGSLTFGRRARRLFHFWKSGTWLTRSASLDGRI